MIKSITMWVLLAGLPLLALAETTARREFEQAVALTPSQEHGRQIFERCAACHNADGGGTLDGKIPRIAGQHYRVLVRQILDFRRGKRWDFRMEGVASSHDILPELQEIADVAWYASNLDRDGARDVGEGHYLQRGADIYARRCSSCHGKQGEGDAKRDMPRLAGQHAAYLARQIYDALEERRPELSATHRKRFAPFEYVDILGLTEYLARIGWTETVTPADPTH